MPSAEKPSTTLCRMLAFGAVDADAEAHVAQRVVVHADPRRADVDAARREVDPFVRAPRRRIVDAEERRCRRTRCPRPARNSCDR